MIKLIVTLALSIGALLAQTPTAPIVPQRSSDRPATAPLPRVDVKTLDANSPQIVALVSAIRKMQALKNTDCRSWEYQSNIHGMIDPSTQSVPVNQCDHGDYYFLSWHRMYIYFFEQLVQRLSGDNNFRLPYWNWSVTGDVPLPPMFLKDTIAGKSNPLLANRCPTVTYPGCDKTKSVPGQASEVASAFAPTSFYHTSGGPLSFGGLQYGPAHQGNGGGTLEVGPHRNIHETAGTWMRYPYTAARDPIFFLHHSNVDRLWESWIQQHPGANPTSDTRWMNHSFTFCEDVGPNSPGRPVPITAAAILNIGDLGYSYDRLENPQPPIRLPATPLVWTALARGAPPVNLLEREIRVPLKLMGNRSRTNTGKILRLVFRDLRWKRPLGVRYEVRLEPMDQGSPAASEFVGFLHFYSFGGSHDARDSSQMPELAEFLLPERVSQWFARSTGDSPVRIHLIMRGLLSVSAPTPDTLADPKIGAIEVLAGR
jgi:hypothetical protein